MNGVKHESGVAASWCGDFGFAGSEGGRSNRTTTDPFFPELPGTIDTFQTAIRTVIHHGKNRGRVCYLWLIGYVLK